MPGVTIAMVKSGIYQGVGWLPALSQTVYKQLCSIDGGYGPRQLASRRVKSIARGCPRTSFSRRRR